ncbi:hypothetical protein AAE478_002555 [Parahypoxylon ruwenzoriense]
MANQSSEVQRGEATNDCSGIETVMQEVPGEYRPHSRGPCNVCSTTTFLNNNGPIRHDFHDRGLESARITIERYRKRITSNSRGSKEIQMIEVEP